MSDMEDKVLLKFFWDRGFEYGRTDKGMDFEELYASLAEGMRVLELEAVPPPAIGSHSITHPGLKVRYEIK